MSNLSPRVLRALAWVRANADQDGCVTWNDAYLGKVLGAHRVTTLRWRKALADAGYVRELGYQVVMGATVGHIIELQRGEMQ